MAGNNLYYSRFLTPAQTSLVTDFLSSHPDVVLKHREAAKALAELLRYLNNYTMFEIYDTCYFEDADFVTTLRKYSIDDPSWLHPLEEKLIHQFRRDYVPLAEMLAKERALRDCIAHDIEFKGGDPRLQLEKIVPKIEPLRQRLEYYFNF